MKQLIPADDAQQAEVNLTPMLDVVFILLIFFVVTASFVHDFGLDIGLPAGIDGSPQELQSIALIVEQDNSFHVNGRPLAKGSLAPYIRRLASENPDAPFAVLVSPKAHVEATVTAVDAGRRAGFARIPVEEWLPEKNR